MWVSWATVRFIHSGFNFKEKQTQKEQTGHLQLLALRSCWDFQSPLRRCHPWWDRWHGTQMIWTENSVEGLGLELHRDQAQRGNIVRCLAAPEYLPPRPRGSGYDQVKSGTLLSIPNISSVHMDLVLSDTRQEGVGAYGWGRW